MVVRRTFTDPASRVERIVLQQEARFRLAFTEGLRLIRDRWTLEQLADLLEQGRFEEALENLDVAAALLGVQSGSAYTIAAQDAARFLSTGLSITIAFDQVNDRAVQAIRANNLRLIEQYTQSQRDATRAALQDGITRGLNPRDQARLFRATVGLTEGQEQAVRNFRALLSGGRNDTPSTSVLNRALRDGRSDRSIRRAIRQGDPLSPAHIEQMVDRYRSRYIKYRSEVIARTEALRSVNEGTEEMYRQGIDMGQFRADQLQRKWVTAGDERVRGSHRALNGVIKPLGQPWEAAGGDLFFPGDPRAPASETIQCRCAISTRISPPSINRNQ